MNKQVLYGLVGGFLLGTSTGILVAKKLVDKNFQERIDEEAKKIRLDYARFYSAEAKPELDRLVDYATEDVKKVQDTAAQRLVIQAKAESDLILSEMNYSMEEIREVAEKIAQNAVITDENVFDKFAASDHTMTYLEDFEDDDVEEHGDMPSPDHPYLITTDEYLERGIFPDQYALRYFESDDTLVEEKGETPVNIEDTVGTEALTQFGRNPKNKDMIHVRNETLKLDFEIQRDKRSYAEVVLGIREDKPAQKKFREDD